ncbi:hypothetical protein OJAV_G00067690 [Oryzias javanicus]|uniref:Uncharacterized protein n=1 Tax=Oryzias javanicus TaxID=123683 RepID=A0A437D662_ORYJA|nr:hypothetical protein OJAV_G00067690 [Oryzias javanicus]
MLLFVTDLPRGVDKVEAGGVQQLAGKRQGGRELERSGKPGRETARLEGDTERQSKEAFREYLLRHGTLQGERCIDTKASTVIR